MHSNKFTTAICIESSHEMGMGHLYRALNLLDYLKPKNVPCILVINNNVVAKEYLKERSINHIVADYDDAECDWESKIIEEYDIYLWINDRLNTEYVHAQNIKKNDVVLVTYDDMGSGARLADLNIAPFAFDESSALDGKSILTGIDYLIMDKEIDGKKRVRNEISKVFVTLGGSDTYGVTVEVLKMLKELDISATIHVGPSFRHHRQLDEMIDDRYQVVECVPSLISEMDKYDLAITGGGITPYQANAMGLPCLTISCEHHEIRSCKYLENIGSSAYLGSKEKITTQVVKKALSDIDIKRMSSLGMERVPTTGAKNVWNAIEELMDA